MISHKRAGRFQRVMRIKDHESRARQVFMTGPNTVQPRFDEVLRDWKNWFVISRVRYIEVLFHTLYYYWAEKYRSLYRGLRYIEVRSIEVPLYLTSDEPS